MANVAKGREERREEDVSERFSPDGVGGICKGGGCDERMVSLEKWRILFTRTAMIGGVQFLRRRLACLPQDLINGSASEQTFCN